MKKWNVAIIGLGFVGKLHYDALRRLPNVHVRTIVVHKAQDIPLVKESYDADVVTDCWQEAVADSQIQVIHNCTPNALHDQINLAAIATGKHLYAEKPMSLTTAGAEEVLAAAKAAGIAHAINYQCRMNGAVLEMRAFPEIDGVDFLGGDTQAREMIKYLLGNRFAVFIRIRHPPIRLEEILRFQIHIVRNFCLLFLLQIFIGTRRLFRLLHSLIIP